MSENEDIKKANEELEKISADKHEQYLAHLRQKHIMDTKAVEEYGYLRGKEEGRAEGKEEGEAIGEARGKKEILLPLSFTSCFFRFCLFFFLTKYQEK